MCYSTLDFLRPIDETHVLSKSCAMATIAEQITALETEQTAINAAITRILTGGQNAGFDGISVGQANLKTLYEQRGTNKKSLQRLLRGGRGMPVDLSYSEYGDQQEDVT